MRLVRPVGRRRHSQNTLTHLGDAALQARSEELRRRRPDVAALRAHSEAAQQQQLLPLDCLDCLSGFVIDSLTRSGTGFAID